MREIAKFLSQIIPDGGRYVGFVAGQTKGTGRNVSAQNIEDLVLKLMQANEQGRNVYFAPAAYGEGGGRKKTDVVGLRALWFDIDAHGDGKGYDTVEEAAQAALDGPAALGLPSPIRVWSGGGVQGWYIFREPLDHALWHSLARALKKGLQSVGVRLDPARTADAASIMRLPGSFNHTRGAQAFIIDDGAADERHDAADFERALHKHGAAVHTVTDNAKPVRQKITRFHKHNKDAGLIVENCAQIRHFQETGSDTEPHWHSAASILATCMDGERLFHEWSSSYQGYSSEEAQAKFDAAIEIDAPHACSSFSEHNDLCEGCIWKGHIKGPAELGVLRSKPAEDVVAASGEVVSFTTWEKEYPDGYALNKAHELVFRTSTPEGQKDELICDTPIRVVGIAKDEDSNKKYVVLQQYNVGEQELEQNIILQRDLTGQSGLTEIRTFGPAIYNPALMTHFITASIAKVNRGPRMADLYKSFGWKREGFLVGQTLFTDQGSKPAALQPDSFASAKAVELQPGGGRRMGSLEGWREAVLPCLQPGYEFQLDALVASFASVLMGVLAPTEGGVLRSYCSPKTGGGKTTASQLAQSVWGLERALQITATASEVTRANIWSGAGGLPTFEDESIRQDAQQVKDRVTAFTLGMNKQRSGRDGKVNPDRDRRSSVHIVTANTSMIAALSQYQGSDAMQARVFETEVPSLPSKGSAKLLSQLTQNPGWAGPIFLDFVLRNLPRIKKTLQATQVYFADMLPDVKYRYKVNYLACASVAAALLNRLELARFDQERYTNWLIAEVKSEPGYSKTDSKEDILREFFDVTRDKTLTVVHGKSPTGKTMVSIADRSLEPREEIAKRYEVHKARMLISRKSLSKFLADYSMSPKEFIKWMVDEGYVERDADADTPRDLTDGLPTYTKGRERVIIMSLKKWKLDDVEH